MPEHEQPAKAVQPVAEPRKLPKPPEAVSKGRPLGTKRATWLLGTMRLLDFVEKYEGGLPARVKAENRLKEFWPIWSRAQELHPDVKEPAAC